MIDKKTLVLVASPKADRYSFQAVELLLAKHVPTVAISRKPGHIHGFKLETELSHYTNIHTITLYLNPRNQVPFYEYIASLKPKRVIFNPGTENKELQDKLDKLKIEWEEACTLVLLRTNQY